MNNRTSPAPILCVAVLSLSLTCAGNGQSLPPSSTTSPAPVTSSVDATPADVHSSAHYVTYTVLKGDSLTSIARKFNTTRKKLKALNSLTANIVKPGQVLEVASLKTGKAASAASHAKSHTFARAQPVQDFDIPASTFASCPVPVPDEDTPAPAPAMTEQDSAEDTKPAPLAKLVSPAEMAADAAAAQQTAPPADAPVVRLAPAPATLRSASASAPAPSGWAHTFPGKSGATFADTSRPSGHTSFTVPSAKSRGGGIASSFGSRPNPLFTTPSDDWGNRFLSEARALGAQGIEYDDDWRPPGEPRSWTMDCSNTSRYLYKVTTGISLPRTASDQYYYLHLQNKAWDVPQTANGFADTNYLRENLKPGDLLFWENTYRPDRQPPITHVMIFLGTNDRGQWIMAGSQSSRGGEHNRRNGGPDIYVFRPSQPCGGYTTWLGLVHHQGRFCAFGRPLEADPSKLAVAANE